MAQNENEFNPEGPPLDSLQVMLEEIINYATTSPENINANVLRSMLYQFSAIAFASGTTPLVPGVIPGGGNLS